ncbi:MAG: PD-(D/E)XK nuclease family protein [Lachnospiraceae bacterium]|nr:PD-(D/E)XK nuclease family protein [Lachnospiraceae bacterium]
MGFHFVFGPSGSGKSTYLIREIIEGAKEGLREMAEGRPAVNYFLIVPDQYTMQTQKALVEAHPDRGIMNIDVSSFGRLAHRLFEEEGVMTPPLLDDMGKTLILRRLAGEMEGELPSLGGRLRRPGYIAEIKSVISEFMQYGIAPEDVDRLIASCREHGAVKAGRGALEGRLADIRTIYARFLEFERDSYATSEETLTLMAETVRTSELVRRSVFVFDGFTGFTPVQNQVLAALIGSARQVVVSLVLSEDGGKPPALVEKTSHAGAEQSLFYLTRKTVKDLTALAAEEGAVREKDIFLKPDGPELPRFAGHPALAHLERCLFRYPVLAFEGDAPEAAVTSAPTVEEEVRRMFRRIRYLTAGGDCCYRDIAVMAADLNSYADAAERFSRVYGIPVYLDRTRAVTHDPLTEAVRAALSVIINDYSYASVFRYLRSGMSALTAEETDILENYCLSHGVRGARRWRMAFDDETEESRKKVLDELEMLRVPRGTAAERTRALALFMGKTGMQEKILALAEEADHEGAPERASEYRQIYQEMMELLDRLYVLLGDEPLSQEEYLELVETGIGEIRLGILPQQADRVLVGDLIRTRLPQVRYLFVLGANDGNIPAGITNGGLISDLDREFLKSEGFALAPTPREQMYTQRLYLYLALTKPTDGLFLSCAEVAEDGRSLRPSYLMGLLMSLLPGARTEDMLGTDSLSDAVGDLAEGARHYAEGALDRDGAERARFLTLYGVLSAERETGKEANRIAGAAFSYYVPEKLSGEAVSALYGGVITGSVSRMEQCAACFGRQFLQYGLRLSERDEYRFEPVDSGSILHSALEEFSEELRRKGIRWTDLGDEEGDAIADSIISRISERYGNQVLYASSRTAGSVGRMKRILRRAVRSLKYQLSQGGFTPYAYELSFGGLSEDRPWLSWELPEGTMKLRGRIDRVDIAEEDGEVYVKIIDYKSGSRDIDREKVNQGRQLQLPVYMGQALRLIRERFPGKEAVPAAMLYCRLYDPYTRTEIPAIPAAPGEQPAGEPSPEVRKALRPSGLVNARQEIITLLDRSLGEGGNSEVIPVRTKKDGSAYDDKSVFTDEEYAEIAEGCEEALKALGSAVLSGETARNPVKSGQDDSCTYCPFRDVCGFDPRLPGYSEGVRN